MRARMTALVVLVFAVGLLVPGVASANGVPIEEIYVDTTLTEDHMGGIAIKEPHVTLDCAGHSLIEDHVSDEGVGVLIEGLTGATVKNCVVEGFDTGVHITGSSDILVKDTVSLSNVYGFFVGGFHPDFPEYESHHVTLRSNSASGAMSGEGMGFLVEGGHDIVLEDNVATGNWDNGFRMRGPSHENVLIGNRASANGSHGVEAHGYFDEATGNEYPLESNVFRDNVSFDNGVIHGGAGFMLGEFSTGNLLVHNNAMRNPWFGFLLVEGASGNDLVQNRAINNGAHGFLVYLGSTGNHLVRNVAVQNGSGVGIFEQSSDALLESNVLCRNEEADLAFDETSEPVLVDNNICDAR